MSRTIKAPTGTKLRAKSWLTEAPLRMLMNNLDPEVAERPQDLVVYGGIGKAARNWECFDAIVDALKQLGNDETLLVQSGKPVGVFRTHADAPRVLIANSNLVPAWAKDVEIGYRMINARAETVAEKPAYRSAYRRRRCLVPADGFFEWKKVDQAEAPKPSKAPFWIHREDRKPFAMAGLWESWRPGEDATPLDTCTLITTAANEMMRPLHDRMPLEEVTLAEASPK